MRNVLVWERYPVKLKSADNLEALHENLSQEFCEVCLVSCKWRTEKDHLTHSSDSFDVRHDKRALPRCIQERIDPSSTGQGHCVIFGSGCSWIAGSDNCADLFCKLSSGSYWIKGVDVCPGETEQLGANLTNQTKARQHDFVSELNFGKSDAAAHHDCRKSN